MRQSPTPTLPERVFILFLYLILFYLLNGLLIGRWSPKAGGDDLWFASAVGFVSFSLFSAVFFVKPKDSLVRALASVILLSSVDMARLPLLRAPLNLFRWTSFAIAIFTVLLAALAIVLHAVQNTSRIAQRLAPPAYRLSTSLGKGAIIFTPPALISIFGFHQAEPVEMLALSLFWIILVVLYPIELAVRCINDMHVDHEGDIPLKMVGKIQRIDSPNIVRVEFDSNYASHNDEVLVACLPDSSHVFLLPLFSQIRDNMIVGTTLSCPDSKLRLPGAHTGCVYRSSDKVARKDLLVKLGCDQDADLVGFVVEHSKISGIQFEIANKEPLAQGQVVFCRTKDQQLFYQILDARTSEENFERNPHGTHVVSAAQLGILAEHEAFKKYPWLPEMNAPVFLPRLCPKSANLVPPSESHLILGMVPGTEVPVWADVSDLLEFHTAVLGVTGTGKTELVYEIIRHAIKIHSKVICVDFTREYGKRLADLNPSTLGLSDENTAEMNDLVEQIETGKFGATEEKKALNEFVSNVRPEVERQVNDFLLDENSWLSLFELEDIANTRATLRATELYLSEIFKWARNNRKARRILLVLEEAHTIIPEVNIFGYDKGETSSVVGRMAQIALQGRKFGVGLCIVSQRTALVSKTVLSQCGTYITFSLVDKTSLEYLGNIYSAEHIEVIPNLRFLNALVFGKGIRCERPIVIEIPYDASKKGASESLNKDIEEVIAANANKDESPNQAPDDVAVLSDDDVPF